ncbi:hypothetical protein GCM10009664_56830 [Kitasatospora gansuensis]
MLALTGRLRGEEVVAGVRVRLLRTRRAPVPPVETFHWSADIISNRPQTLHFTFAILTRDGQVAGYCAWDPYVLLKG